MSAVAKKKPLDIERIRERLTELGLNHAAEARETALTDAVRDGTTAQAFLDALLGAEAEARESRRVATALRLSSLPPGLTLGSFDFGFQPSVERSRIDTLATSG